MSRSSRITRTLIAAVTVAAGARASAGDCTTSPSDPACYHLKGSDTLFDIMTTAINNARAASVPGAANLFYDGTGSGNAEAQMTYNLGTGAPVGGMALPLGVQSIGPMSRNFRPKFIDSAWSSFTAADGTSSAKVGHASWAPSCYNVLGLDAAVVLTKGSGAGSSCKNLNFPAFTDAAISNAATTRANTNNTALPTSYNDASAFNNTSATVNYSNLLMVILSGVDGSGSLAACSDPRRVQAVQDLAGCMGVGTIDHVYRRDDNSGTTDTFKDRILIVSNADTRYPWIGGRFCNAQSIGGIAGATSQTGVCSSTRTNTTCKKDSDCPSGEVCQFNLNNQDFDPIRRPCVAADGTHAPTSCTDMATGRPCQAGEANCTQGLVVALSDADPGSDSVTNSIGARVRNDLSGQSIGYAGREAVLPGKGTRGFTLNTIGFSDANVRKDAYLLSRRLFLQNALVAGQPAPDQPSDTAGPNIGITGQGGSQLTAEQNLFAFLTDPNGSMSGGLPGRYQIDPIVKQFNFITCSTDSSIDPCGLPNNLCAKTPSAPVASPLSAYVPNGSFVSGGSGGAKSIDSQGNVWNGSSAVPASCSTGNFCVSGASCSSGTCPTSSGRPAYAACSRDIDCASGLHCIDPLGLNVPGAYLQCG